MICPVCEQAGQHITCTAGNRVTEIMYHPGKITRNICTLANGGAEHERAPLAAKRGGMYALEDHRRQSHPAVFGLPELHGPAAQETDAAASGVRSVRAADPASGKRADPGRVQIEKFEERR